MKSKSIVWCVTDVDVDPNTPGNIPARNAQLKEFAEKAKENGFKIALSNPCFELWFLLHFEYTTGHMQNFEAVKQRLAVPTFLSNYEKNKDVYPQLKDKLETALQNAKQLESHYEEQGITDFLNVSVNPYTGVWELVQFIKE